MLACDDILVRANFDHMVELWMTCSECEFLRNSLLNVNIVAGIVLIVSAR